jgi:hypothetical protein
MASLLLHGGHTLQCGVCVLRCCNLSHSSGQLPTSPPPTPDHTPLFAELHAQCRPYPTLPHVNQRCRPPLPPSLTPLSLPPKHATLCLSPHPTPHLIIRLDPVQL